MKQINKRPTAGEQLLRLMELVVKLRAPDGCPWDRKQTPESAARYLIEEAFEAVEAIETGDIAETRGELGDVLFQVVFLANLFAEQGQFDLARVIEESHAKMVRRHPHVFGDDKAEDPDQVLDLWGKVKKKERKKNGQGILDSVPVSAPGLIRAQRLGERAGKVGFDWAAAPAVWEKIKEEMAELKTAPSPEKEQEEFGDLLFACAQWARHRKIDAEAALRKANAKFQRRFKAMEGLAKERGLELESLSEAQYDDLWEEVKKTA